MSADKNYSAKLSVICNLRSCKIARVEAKSDTVDKAHPGQSTVSQRCTHFLPALARKAELYLTDETGGARAPFLQHIPRYTKYAQADVTYTVPNEGLIKQDSLYYMRYFLFCPFVNA